MSFQRTEHAYKRLCSRCKFLVVVVSDTCTIAAVDESMSKPDAAAMQSSTHRQRNRVVIPGARTIWGTMRTTTCMYCFRFSLLPGSGKYKLQAQVIFYSEQLGTDSKFRTWLSTQNH